LLSAIPPDTLLDQYYAFRPTGSTTAALVHLMHHVTKMLERNNYVRSLMIDFSKAFDTVDHTILLPILVQFHPPPFVINWICFFLTGRGHQRKINGLLSNVEPISLSIVQRSGIGPIIYAIMKSDLHTLSDLNDIFKYADDSTVLVPELANVGLADEFARVKVWTSINRLILNFDKTKEIVVRLRTSMCLYD